MITLTDHEQATALRSARYALQGLRGTLAAIQVQGDATRDAQTLGQIAIVERVIDVLEKRGTPNGVWRCKCSKWHQPGDAACAACSDARP